MDQITRVHKFALAVVFCLLSELPATAFCIAGFGDCDISRIKEALESSDIVGSWSYDCANEKASRFVFKASPPAYEFVTPEAIETNKIVSAIRVTNEKIRLKSTRITDSTVVDSDELYLKQDGKLRIIESTETTNGKARVLVHDGVLYAAIDLKDLKGATYSSGINSTSYEQCLN